MDSMEVIEYWISARYRNAPKTKAWINAVGSQLMALSVTYGEMTYNIDEAEGIQLDIIGRIIDLERKLIPIKSDDDFFGYLNTPHAVGYDVEPYFDYSANNMKPLPDRYFRVALKAKVLFNMFDGSRDSAIKAFKLMTGFDVRIDDNEDMSYGVTVFGDLQPDVTAALNLYQLEPTPAGVKFTGYVKG